MALQVLGPLWQTSESGPFPAVLCVEVRFEGVPGQLVSIGLSDEMYLVTPDRRVPAGNSRFVRVEFRLTERSGSGSNGVPERRGIHAQHK